MIEISDQWAVVDHWWMKDEEVARFLYAEIRVGDDKCILRHNQTTHEFEIYKTEDDK